MYEENPQPFRGSSACCTHPSFQSWMNFKYLLFLQEKDLVTLSNIKKKLQVGLTILILENCLGDRMHHICLHLTLNGLSYVDGNSVTCESYSPHWYPHHREDFLHRKVLTHLTPQLTNNLFLVQSNAQLGLFWFVFQPNWSAKFFISVHCTFYVLRDRASYFGEL